MHYFNKLVNFISVNSNIVAILFIALLSAFVVDTPPFS